MIVVDMNMPTDCVDCPIDCFPYGAEDTDYSTTNRPNCCPIKCDIEDIRADIEETIESYVCDKEENTMKAQGMLNAMRMTFEIIDKHIKESEK